MIKSKCPVCDDEATFASADPGDFSCCVRCGSLLVFRDDLSRRVATIPEHAKIVVACPGLKDVLPRLPAWADSF